MLLTKEVEVKINSRNIEHYKNLGYEIPMRKATKRTKEVMHKDYVYDLGATITVKTEDLSNGSHVKVDVLCDYCKKEIISKIYKNYINESKNNSKDACKKCKIKKSEETHFLNHGVNKPLQTQESMDKFKDTCKERYSVENVFQSEEYKNKIRCTLLEKYGVDSVFKVPEFEEKRKNTWISHYGVDSPLKSEEILEKVKNTNLKKYGYPCVLQAPEIKEKISKSFYKHSSIPTSSQQLYIQNLYDGELNYPIKYYNADICFPDEKLDIEIDFGGHNLPVKMGKLTQEEFDKKEIIRNNIIKREGYKQMRIISSKDYLPQDEKLLEMLEHTRQYFSDYPNHSWIEYNIDSSSIRNAENKDGVFYDYGELRKIKKSA